jgi:polyhydroxyalkanoate synthesis regulator phasin
MSLGKWILKTFDKTDVDGISEKVDQLERQVSDLKEDLRKHKEGEENLSTQNEEFTAELSVANKQLASLKNGLSEKDSEIIVRYQTTNKKLRGRKNPWARVIQKKTNLDKK